MFSYLKRFVENSWMGTGVFFGRSAYCSS